MFSLVSILVSFFHLLRATDAGFLSLLCLEDSSPGGKQDLEPAVQPGPHCETLAKETSFGEVQSLWSDATSSFNPNNSEQGADPDDFFPDINADIHNKST